MEYKRLNCILAGFRPQPYTVRGVSDWECLSVVASDEETLTILADIIENCDDEDEAAELLRAARLNRVGFKTAIYWPSIRVGMPVE
jgi:hypothetical protein